MGIRSIVPSHSAYQIHGPIDDATKLYKDFGIKMQNLVELSYMARQADKTLRFGGKLHARSLISLERLVGGYLNKRLLKDDVRTSNWEVKLSNEQLECERVLQLKPPV